MTEHGQRSRGGGNLLGGIGAGLAIGVIGGAVHQATRPRPEAVEVQGSRRTATPRKSGPSQVRTTGKDKDRAAQRKKPPKKEIARKPGQPAKAVAGCADCASLQDSIAGYEEILKDQAARLKAETEYKLRHERELANITDPGMRNAWSDVIAASEERIRAIVALTDKIKAVLADRRSQLKDKLASHNTGNANPPAPPAPVTDVPTAPPPTAQNPPASPPLLPPTAQRPPVSTSPPPGSGTTPPPEPTQVTSSSGPCPNHEAELTNGTRVFHRLYVKGPDDILDLGWWWQLNKLKDRLEAPGRQAPGSTTRALDEPSYEAFEAEVKKLQTLAKACEEVTISIFAHGMGGPRPGQEPARERQARERSEQQAAAADPMIQPVADSPTVHEDYAEFVRIGPNGATLLDAQLGELVKGFAPDVSVTVIMNSCYGGGFAGKGNVEESKLVQLLGIYTVCPSNDVFFRTTFLEAIGNGVDQAAGKEPNNRSTAADVKGHLTRTEWPLGEPFDNSTDGEIRGNIGRIVPDTFTPGAVFR